MNRRWWWLLVPLLVLAMVSGGFLAWALTPLGPGEDALGALESGKGVTVTEIDSGWVFAPDTGSSETTTGLVFYGGGRVDARSYAPLARGVAELGHVVVIAKAPLSLQVLDPDAAAAVFAAPEVNGVERWAVGGHSLGGAMAASWLGEDTERAEGLLLIAAYPPDGTDISTSGLPVTDVVGTLDGVLDRETWESARGQLPPDTVVVEIAGGNHAQFGDYGEQPGDNPAETTADQQLESAVGAAHRLLFRMAVAP